MDFNFIIFIGVVFVILIIGFVFFAKGETDSTSYPFPDKMPEDFKIVRTVSHSPKPSFERFELNFDGSWNYSTGVLNTVEETKEGKVSEGQTEEIYELLKKINFNKLNNAPVAQIQDGSTVSILVFYDNKQQRVLSPAQFKSIEMGNLNMALFELKNEVLKK